MIDQLLSFLSARDPIHAKKIATNHAAEPGMVRDLERFLKTYQPFMTREGIGYEQLGSAYLRMVEQMMASRLDFVRTGKYATELPEHADAAVYDNPEVMVDYMLGLALSQFLWKHHYEVFSFYRRTVREAAVPAAALEVGSGHGLLLLELLAAQPAVPVVDVIDISDTSLRLTKSLLDVVAASASKKVRFIKGDVVLLARTGTTYDFITIGEVLEHVANPVRVLEALRARLTPGGTIFLSTCANCPTIDHVYHFETVDEIRKMIADAGLAIRDELVSPSENLSADMLAKHRLDIIYAAAVGHPRQ